MRSLTGETEHVKRHRQLLRKLVSTFRLYHSHIFTDIVFYWNDKKEKRIRPNMDILKPVLLSWILRISQRQSTTDSSLFSRSRQKCAFFQQKILIQWKIRIFWHKRAAEMDSTLNFGLEKVWLKEILSLTQIRSRVKDFGLKSLKRAPGGWKTL